MQPHILSQTFKTSSLIMNFYISLFLFLKGKVLIWCLFLLNHLLIVYCGTHSLPLLMYIKYTSGIYAPHQDLINLSDKNGTWLTDSGFWTPCFVRGCPLVHPLVGPLVRSAGHSSNIIFSVLAHYLFQIFCMNLVFNK